MMHIWQQSAQQTLYNTTIWTLISLPCQPKHPNSPRVTKRNLEYNWEGFLYFKYSSNPISHLNCLKTCNWDVSYKVISNSWHTFINDFLLVLYLRRALGDSTVSFLNNPFGWAKLIYGDLTFTLHFIPFIW